MTRTLTGVALATVVAALAAASRSPRADPFAVLSPSTWLRQYPLAEGREVDAFSYWSIEYYGSGKPVMSVTQVSIIHRTTIRA